MLSASANKLSKLKEQASEYAALIMEELDVDRMGYIEVNFNIPLASNSFVASLLGWSKVATMKVLRFCGGKV